MKSKILKLLLFYSLLLAFCVALFGAGCNNEDDGDEWIKVEPIIPNISISAKLDSIFLEGNDCLIDFQKDTVYNILFSQKELIEINKCNTMPNINFDEYSLVVGIVKVSSISDSISAIVLNSNEIKDVYNLEVSIHEPEGRYGAVGFLYFWRLYPKLNSGYEKKIIINKV
jgi:hypothetical protein